jgi:hypothetical protein
MKINREALLKLYIIEIEHISESFDWKTQFGPEEIVNLIASIIEKHPTLLSEKD